MARYLVDEEEPLAKAKEEPEVVEIEPGRHQMEDEEEEKPHGT